MLGQRRKQWSNIKLYSESTSRFILLSSEPYVTRFFRVDGTQQQHFHLF